MTHKLDLVAFYINHSRQLQSKWHSMSRNDLILLSGFSLDEKNYSVTYRHNEKEVLLELGDSMIQPDKNLEVFITTIDWLGSDKWDLP